MDNKKKVNNGLIEKALAKFGFQRIPSENPFVKEPDLNKGIGSQNSEQDLAKAAGDLLKGLGIDVDALKKAEDIVKGFSQLNDLVKGIEDANKAHNIKHGRLLSKALSTVESLSESNKKLRSELKKAQVSQAQVADRVKKIEDTPLPAKTVTKDYVEKGGFSSASNNNDQQTVLSMSRDKQEIKNMLGARMEGEFIKGVTDGIFAKAAEAFDFTGALLPEAIKELNKDNIQVVN